MDLSFLQIEILLSILSNSDDEYLNKRKEIYGECPTCYRYNTDYSWCQSCDPQLLTQGWSSDNKTIDELIKSTQLEATRYNNADYLEWIPYDKLKDIKKIGEGGFSTVYKATWINGKKYVDRVHNKRCYEDMIVALKKLHNSQNICDEFLNEVKYLLLLIHFLQIFNLTINIFSLVQKLY